MTTPTAEPLEHETTPAPSEFLLEVSDLVTEFPTAGGPLRANDRVSFRLEAGTVLGILGESGCGKSALLRTLLGVQPKRTRVSGRAVLAGVDLLALDEQERRASRGRDVAMIFQDPLTALDPVYTVRRQLTETIRIHDGLGRKDASARALELLELVQIPSPERRLDAYPFELSGGMRQRVVIAMALACRPQLLLADEPTTALDVTVQARVLELLRELQVELGMGVIFVTHDLAVAATVSDRLAVMYAGRIVETGTVEEVVERPSHPYTRGLMAANVQPGQQERPGAIRGAPPNIANLPPGCSFAPRCDHAVLECWRAMPELAAADTASGEAASDEADTTSGHRARCLFTAAELDAGPSPGAGRNAHLANNGDQ
ncbi:MAG: ABC transporter ATP-binding protein [Actinomycetota bacterium]